MERNPKKSKAFIITFIIIFLILLGVYFLIKNRATLFSTNGGSITKIFSPLLGSSKPKDVTVVTNGGDTGGSTTGDGTNGGVDTGTGTGTGSNTVGTIGSTGSLGGNTGAGGATTNGNGTTDGGGGVIYPAFNPIPTPTTDCINANGTVVACTDTQFGSISTECTDGKDNDGDKLTDTLDPSCHTDFTTTNSLSYDRTINNEARTKGTATATVIAMCPDDPLVFTEEEKAQLTTLLRQYYLLSPTLRIEDDVTLLNYDNTTNEELIKQATILTQDCKEQKSDFTYTGPKEIKDNPYYQNNISGGNAPAYVSGYSLYEMMFNIW